MFEECFSMIELNLLVEEKALEPARPDDDQMFENLTHAVLGALKAALLDPEPPARTVH